jgi:hypothetical protein
MCSKYRQAMSRVATLVSMKSNHLRRYALIMNFAILIRGALQANGLAGI